MLHRIAVLGLRQVCWPVDVGILDSLPNKLFAVRNESGYDTDTIGSHAFFELGAVQIEGDQDIREIAHIFLTKN